MRYEKGDILVQCQGEPWCFLAELVTKHPFPHAAIISEVVPGIPYTSDFTDLAYGIYQGHQVRFMENHLVGLVEIDAYDLQNYEVWRPLTDAATVDAAIAWIRGHLGEGYGYFRLAEIVIGYPLGRRARPGMDNDVSQDGRRKVCSETIGMGYLRAGQQTGTNFDAAPGVQDRDTLPFDLRGPLNDRGVAVSRLEWSPRWLTSCPPMVA